ncbi:uncharacterized protein ARMOST_18505 [Armillaria ostoyae]|uniref:Uncharacterized protein n=1 Tax=Armillaria ostoyae TaxID=47428 RepID=A0A284S1Z9_ARMOS|nr:uncharacterized protein ARMOST_18505 [Armillaria ostoyae]
MAARRTALVDELRKKWGLVIRVPYKRTITSDNECLRSTISEDQSGVHTFIDLELIDVSIYETASDLYIDFWHCNSTGVYSGVLGSGNGNPSDLSSVINTPHYDRYPSKPSSVASSQPTKRNKRPSSLSSRVTLLDVSTRSSKAKELYSATALLPPSACTTLDLISIIGATSPYNTNIIEITTNAIDQVFVLGFGSTILEYLYLAGVSLVDMNTMYEIIPAATLTEHGGAIHDPSSIEAGNMTGDFPSGTGSDHSTSSGSNTTGNLPSGD